MPMLLLELEDVFLPLLALATLRATAITSGSMSFMMPDMLGTLLTNFLQRNEFCVSVF